jgi:hypothetical protein
MESMTTSTRVPRARPKTLLWIALGLTTLFVFITSEVFLAADYPMYHAYRLQVVADRPLLIPHTLCGTIALLAGPLQFSSRFRQRHLAWHRVVGRLYVLSVFIGAFTGVALAMGRPGLPGTSMQAGAWIVCTTAAFLTARNRHIAVHRQWMIRSYAVTFTFVSSRVLNLWPRYWSHLGDTFAAFGVAGFTLASLLLVDLAFNWRELTTRRLSATATHQSGAKPVKALTATDFNEALIQMARPGAAPFHRFGSEEGEPNSIGHGRFGSLP